MKLELFQASRNSSPFYDANWLPSFFPKWQMLREILSFQSANLMLINSIFLNIRYLLANYLGSLLPASVLK